jgi:hypothetical protein
MYTIQGMGFMQLKSAREMVKKIIPIDEPYKVRDFSWKEMSFRSGRSHFHQIPNHRCRIVK